MNILAIGDVVGKPGRQAVSRWLGHLKKTYAIDFCFANAENASGGLGLDENGARELLDAGIDALTLGNHAFAKKQVFGILDAGWPVIRPANGPEQWPGTGMLIVPHEKATVALINLSGRVFMDGLDDPFQCIDRLLNDSALQQVKCILIDFHAEATAEKTAFAHHVKDRVTAVFGTHTHVQTADERLLGSGTAYITDLGMTGPSESVIGMNIEASLVRFAARLPSRYEVADGPVMLQGAVIAVDRHSGQARCIERVCLREDIA